MTDSFEQQNHQDNRDSFRISAEINISFRIATTEEMQNPNLAFDPEETPNNPILQNLEKLNLTANNLIINATQGNEALAEYLNILEKRISILSVCLQSDKPSQPQPQTVNLSESGIAFYSANKFDINDYLRIKLQFIDSSQKDLAAYVKIVNIAPKENGYILRTKITNMDSAAKQSLRRYIMLLQTKDKS